MIPTQSSGGSLPGAILHQTRVEPRPRFDQIWRNRESGDRQARDPSPHDHKWIDRLSTLAEI